MTGRYEYAGFWIRLGASLVDTLLMVLITIPLLIIYYGFDTYWQAAQSGEFLGLGEVIISWLFPIVATIWFWLKMQATPGKILFSLKVLDEKTGQPLTLNQSVIRYLGYFASTIVLGLGFIWIAFDGKKQGWHDKMAGSVVVRDYGMDVMPLLVEE
ncbi:RDD family protein [Alkanindiges illinoisensis]|uniref:RDD family protein n=1 Tax=Alkanindiges illinoisensis TaxID=197183 RepID=A0A4Y7XFF9_9GAMM|nr:RDD family protein [Alkanindiges illinoisensis]TEU30558.1 RDD family protein [Alkanindiges illinoisensis]